MAHSPASNRKITIGSRGSDLALWQANYVKDALEKLGHEVVIEIIRTQGDKIQHLSLDKLEGKGFFTKEIENHLLQGKIDLAVHSHKDLETEQPEGLKIAAVSYRHDPHEFILVRKERADEDRLWSLPENAVVGTSSNRRKSQLLAFRPDIELKDLRGNVPTRIGKLAAKNYDAIIIAFAGVDRLDVDTDDFICHKLDPEMFIPAPAQGVLAMQVRETDIELTEILNQLNDMDTAEHVGIERKVLNLMKGGCHLPLGVYVKRDKGKEFAWACLAEKAGDPVRRVYMQDEISANKLVTKLRQPLAGRKVFISKDLDELDELLGWLKFESLDITATSLIDIAPVKPENLPEADWLFFSSGNSVHHFFSQVSIRKGQFKIGAIGSATAGRIKKHGFQVDYIGKGGDPARVGKAFGEIADGTVVVFPQSNISLRSVQKSVPEGVKAHDLVVYETTEKEKFITGMFDVYVFTSPSNVRAFFQKNSIPDTGKVIAMGVSTARTLNKAGVHHAIVPYDTHQTAIADTIMGCL